MLRIGLTGGMGSGKSTVANIFEVLGIPVYNADAASKKLMNEDAKVKAGVQKAFGKNVYRGGKLDKNHLAKIVFSDKNKLELLNSIVHPATLQDAKEWIEIQNAPYIIKEAALLFESGAHTFLDHVIGVNSPEHLRIARIMKRDKISLEEILNRVNKQMKEEEKMRLCDFIIINNEKQMLIPQVLALHQQFLQINSTNQPFNH